MSWQSRRRHGCPGAGVNLPTSRGSRRRGCSSLRSFSTSVVRRRFSRRAACATVPRERCSACSMRLRSIVGRCARRSRPSSGQARASRGRGVCRQLPCGRRAPRALPRARQRVLVAEQHRRPARAQARGICDLVRGLRATQSQIAPRTGRYFGGRSRDLDHAAARRDRQPLDQVGQLAHVAGPGALREAASARGESCTRARPSATFVLR